MLLQVTEIYNFAQDDLMTEDIFILDCHSEIFVWVGQQVDTKTKLQALTIGEVRLSSRWVLSIVALWFWGVHLTTTYFGKVFLGHTSDWILGCQYISFVIYFLKPLWKANLPDPRTPFKLTFGCDSGLLPLFGVFIILNTW